MKNSFSLLTVSALVFGIASAIPNNNFTQTLKDQEYDAKVGNFFERSKRQKTFEHFEYRCTPGNLRFYLTSDHLDPKLFGIGIRHDAQEFVHQLQETVKKVITSNDAVNRRDLAAISKHAIPLCNLCAKLERKRRDGEPLGNVPAETTWYLLWPYTEGDAQKFYDNACGEEYQELSDEKLAEVVEATK